MMVARALLIGQVHVMFSAATVWSPGFENLRKPSLRKTCHDNCPPRFSSGVGGLGLGHFHGRTAHAAIPKDADVVVIGAGAAGIAAARRLAAANVKVAVLEATDRVGGRCQTDLTTFGIPFDRGARWLYPRTLIRLPGWRARSAWRSTPLRNPRRSGSACAMRAPARSRIIWHRWCAPIAQSRIRTASPTPQHSMRCRGISAPGRATLAFALGPAAISKDLRDVSAFDLARQEPRDAGAFCRQGLGTLVAKLAEAVPVSLVDAGDAGVVAGPKPRGRNAGGQADAARGHRHGLDVGADLRQFQVRA